MKKHGNEKYLKLSMKFFNCILIKIIFLEFSYLFINILDFFLIILTDLTTTIFSSLFALVGRVMRCDFSGEGWSWQS
jgi:hypothetical protein